MVNFQVPNRQTSNNTADPQALSGTLTRCPLVCPAYPVGPPRPTRLAVHAVGPYTPPTRFRHPEGQVPHDPASPAPPRDRPAARPTVGPGVRTPGGLQHPADDHDAAGGSLR